VQFSQKIGLDDELKDKRIRKAIEGLLCKVESYFGVRLGRKSKRSKKLSVVAAA